MEIITDVFFIIVKVFALYFGVISVFALLKPKGAPETEERLKFAVLVPARNEESCISGIVESINNQNYPSELLDIYVIPNNCTDNTAEAAARAGAKILSVSPSVRSKGAALNESIDKLLVSDENYDAFCVFDADNEADENFIAAMNRTLCSGARVAKSKILSKNRYQSWVCACYDIYFCVANLFMNRAREKMGMSARLIGTGFAVRRDYLEEIGGFCTETITEDAEFNASCAAYGERVAFCEDAITYDEEPLSFKTSLTQRRRWMSGIMQVAQIKLGDLFRGINRTNSVVYCIDSLMQFLFAYVQALMPIAFVLAVVANPLGMLGSIPLSILFGYLGGVANAIIVLVMEKRLDARMIPGILMYPFFMLSFIPLQTISLFKRTTVWQEIHHTGVRRKVTNLQRERRIPETAA